MGTFEFDFKRKHQKTTLTNIHRKVIDALLNRKIAIDIEKDFPPYQADIYIPSKNYIVECDGNFFHGGRKGTEHDRTRDKVLTTKYKVARVIRILGSDIQNTSKLKLVIDGIEQDNLIDKLKVGDSIILYYTNKNYKGVITKINKFSYTAKIKSLNKYINIDKHGLTNINKQWFRCVKMTKLNMIPLWFKSLCTRFELVIKNKNLDESQEVFDKVKKVLNDCQR